MHPNSTRDAQPTGMRRQGVVYRWVRQLHLWLGAWGALAAVLYGLSGLVMNHRFGDAPWPQGESAESARLMLAVPVDARADPASLSAWLRTTHGLDPHVVRRGKPAEGRLRGKVVQDAPKWTLSGGTARSAWSAEFVPGNATVEVRQTRHTLLAGALRLHKGYGGGWLWSRLADSFAIGMVLLGISGLWMWARGRGLRELVISITGLSAAVVAVVIGIALR